MCIRDSIKPEPWREFDSYYYDWDYSYTLAFDTEPSTDYTICLLYTSPSPRDS